MSRCFAESTMGVGADVAVFLLSNDVSRWAVTLKEQNIVRVKSKYWSVFNG